MTTKITTDRVVQLLIFSRFELRLLFSNIKNSVLFRFKNGGFGLLFGTLSVVILFSLSESLKGRFPLVFEV